MSSKLIPAMQRAFLAAGWAALRFNFRGVGRSEGSYEGGVGEVSDVLAALDRLRMEITRADGVVGWSFGALVAMNGVAKDGPVESFVGIAPPVRAAFETKFELPRSPISTTGRLDRCSSAVPRIRSAAPRI